MAIHVGVGVEGMGSRVSDCPLLCILTADAISQTLPPISFGFSGASLRAVYQGGREML